MFVKCLIICALVATSAWARTTGTSHNSIHHQEEARSQESPSYLGDLRYVYKVYKECAAVDLTSCLKLKLVAAMDRAARSYADMSLFDGVSFVKDPNAAATPIESKTETEIEADLPRSLSERDDALNSMIAEKASSFLESHTLQVR